MRKVLKPSETEQLRDRIGPELYARLQASRHLCAAAGDAYVLSLRYCDIREPAHREERITLYCSASELIFAGDDRRCLDALLQAGENEPPARQLLQFFLALTADDVDALEKTEDDITALEDGMLTSGRPAKGAERKIITMRRNLLRIKRYYEQLAIVTSALAENENGLFDDALQRRYASLNRRVDHLLESVRHLREVITQVREAYQAQIDIEQNQIMKVFTVITAIFLPLTLIVGWYGMNLRMPEFEWRFGYPYVIVLSIAVCVFCVVLFRRKKWF